jgi:hypothetical protein
MAAGVGGKARWLARRTLLLRERAARDVVGATLVEARARRVSDGGSIPPASTCSPRPGQRGGVRRSSDRRRERRVKSSRERITYYEVEPKGRLASLFAGASGRRGSGVEPVSGLTGVAVASGGGLAPEQVAAGRGRSFWVLMGLAGFIVLLVIAVIVLAVGEPAPAVSSPSTDTTGAAQSTTTTTLSEGAVPIIPPTTESTLPGNTGPTVYTHPLPDPVRIVIPAISTAADIIPVGVEKEGVMQTPPARTAGWYKLGPAPGAPGPAVIIAHSYFNHERDVFYNLKRLQAGDEIQVYDGSGDVAVFLVDSKEEILKTELPTERIWNNTSEPVLRLITCGGAFDPETRHFLSNVVVYAHLAQ